MSKYIDPHEFAARTYITRMMFDETQVQYAKRLGVCERTIRSWENEKIEKPIQRNFESVQRRYRYFKTEVKQGIQIKMKRRSDNAIIWSRMRDIEGIALSIYGDEWQSGSIPKEEYIIQGFRRINLMKTKLKIKTITAADEMIKAYR